MPTPSGADGGGGASQHHNAITVGEDADTMLAQLRTLPAEALAAMLRQQITHTQALQRSNAEMLAMLQRRDAGQEEARGGEDDGVRLDDDDVVMLRETIEENVEVIKRKCDLAVLMYDTLISTAGRHGVSSDLKQDIEKLHASTQPPPSTATQSDASEGLYL